MLAKEQVIETVRSLRNHDNRANRALNDVQMPIHREVLRNRTQGFQQLRAVRKCLELDAHEEALLDGIVELLALSNVSVEVGNGSGHRGDDAGDRKSVV